MKRMSLLAALGGAMALAACQSGIEIESKPVPLKKAGHVTSDRVVGKAQMVVRAYTLDSAGKRQEMSGASCNIASKELRGGVTTPAIATYPLFIQANRFPNAGKPGNVKVTCRAKGKTVSRTFEPFPAAPGHVGTTTTTTFSDGTTISTSTTRLTGNHLQTYPWRFAGQVEMVFE